MSYIRREQCTSTTPLGYVVVSHFDYFLAFVIIIKHIFTDANLRRKGLLKAINHLAHQLLLKASDVIDDSTHLVLELQAKEDACNYYFVQHNKRLLFWLQDFDEPISIYEHVKGVKCDTHISGCLLALLIRLTYKQTIEMALEAQYWFVDRIVYVADHLYCPTSLTSSMHLVLHSRWPTS
jgi:hypothetical protein